MKTLEAWVGRRVASIVLGLSVSGCGGSVDLGGESRGGSRDVFVPVQGASAPNETGAMALRFVEQFSAEALVADEESLYVFGFGVGTGTAIVRCEKQRCAETAQVLSVPSSLQWIQTFDGRMGAVRGEDVDLSVLTAYSLPGLGEEEVVIGGLPQLFQQPPLFHGGFVYWSFARENGIYRCALPHCAAGPVRIQPQRISGPLRVEGARLFFVSEGVIHRAEALGEQPAHGVTPDEQLSETAPYDGGVVTAFETYAMATAGGMLYASSRSVDCVSECFWTLARWPAGGGARQPLVESANAVTHIFVQGAEMAWVERDTSRENGLLFSCLIAACATTRRELGAVQSMPAVVGDDDNWYWLEAEDRGPDEIGRPQWSYRQLRRTPLLRSVAP